jgi:hypothetical protein
MNELVPSEFYLSQNYPNPFKEKTTIKYCVAHKTRVKITVYDSDSEVIEKLVDEEKQPGTYEVEFSVCHSHGSLPDGKAGGNPITGTFSYQLEAGDYSNQKTMIISHNNL